VPDVPRDAIRRTTTIDMVRPDGFSGPVVLHGRGREETGAGVLRAVARLDVTVDLAAGVLVGAIDAEPAVPGLEALVGVRASSGFRARLAELDVDPTSIVHQLLDDVPTATLVSGFATQAAGPPPTKGHEEIYLTGADQCAGWATGATILLDIQRTGAPGILTGPIRPDADDLVGLEDLPPHGMRRQRRTDVWTEEGVIHVVSWFRDSHMSAELLATVVHEYDVVATGDVETGVVTSAVATARSLPWVECPRATGSAGWTVGRRFADLRVEVRDDFKGIGTCTHLNDQLRSLADVPALL
jgi:hypothetical protein